MLLTFTAHLNSDWLRATRGWKEVQSYQNNRGESSLLLQLNLSVSDRKLGLCSEWVWTTVKTALHRVAGFGLILTDGIGTGFTWACSGYLFSNKNIIKVLTYNKMKIPPRFSLMLFSKLGNKFLQCLPSKIYFKKISSVNARSKTYTFAESFPIHSYPREGETQLRIDKSGGGELTWQTIFFLLDSGFPSTLLFSVKVWEHKPRTKSLKTFKAK